MDKLALLLMVCAGAGAVSIGDSSKSLQRFCCNDGQNWLAGSRVDFITLDIGLTI